jgi:hypothetical protein
MIETQWLVVLIVSINRIKGIGMNRVKSLISNVLAIGFIAFSMSGCSTMMEGIQSQMEVPTLEKQANRVAIGMTIVRENNIMAFKMPISADAKWPGMVAAEIDDE